MSFEKDLAIVNAAGTGGEYGLTVTSRAIIEAVYIADTDGIAADNTDYVTCAITGTTGYDSRAANQGALTADTPLALTLSRGAVVVEAGGQLKATVTKGGSGKAMEAAVTWRLRYIN